MTSPDLPGTWVRPGRPERFDVAEALGWPHRYRGGLIMLMATPLAKAAYAWCRATAPDGDLPAATTNCLGLTLDDGLDDAAFDRVRVEIRERAVGLGLPPRPYAVTTVRPGAPHASDTVNVVRPSPRSRDDV